MATPTLKDFDYEDLKVIGRGQYGKAHLVRHAKDQCSYIAKTIDLTCLSNKERLTAEQEVELLRRLDHPNIVEYKDNFFMGETLVIVMQFCDGGDLAAYIKENHQKKKHIKEEVIMNYFVQVVQALQYIHSERILHRDLKTSNLFLTNKQRVVKLGDFGISRVLEGSIEAAITVVGTPYYMSPEVCENKPYTFKSDVWSLGCVLYELCMLKHAFSADNLLGLVYKIVSDKYEPIPRIYPQDLNNLIQRMLTKLADARPSVRDLLADPYVKRFMNEYVRTGGQCATPASRAGASVGHGNSSGSAPRRVARSSGGAPGSTELNSTVTGLGAGAPVVASGRGSGGSRLRPARGARPARGRGGGGTANLETPKEAMERRKREAADRKAGELKVAALAAAQKKEHAKQMMKAEFQTTHTRMAAVASSSAPTWRPGGNFDEVDGKPSEAWPLQGDGSTVSGSLTPEEELEEPLEEISEAESEAESYEDDFEDDIYTEDELPEELDDEYDHHFGRHAEVGHLSTVREEQDFTRVMSNYEQDLRRSDSAECVDRLSGASPGARRSGDMVAQASTGRLQATGTVSAPQGVGVMDMRSRASRLREELMGKMGPEQFKLAFDFLVRARREGTEEKKVKRQLEELVGRETYKMYGFLVDQLVFQQVVYS